MNIIAKNLKGGGKTLTYLLAAVFAANVWAANVASSAKSPALIPAPREIALTGGTYASVAKFKIERVAGIPSEGYELFVKPDCVIIRASDKAGEFYARQTLLQLLDGKTIPCCEIKDSPRFKWRGVQLDDVRHFMGKETVKRIIDEMAKKLGRSRFFAVLLYNRGYRTAEDAMRFLHFEEENLHDPSDPHRRYRRMCNVIQPLYHRNHRNL